MISLQQSLAHLEAQVASDESIPEDLLPEMPSFEDLSGESQQPQTPLILKEKEAIALRSIQLAVQDALDGKGTFH